MAADKGAWLSALSDLLPPGQAWTRDPYSVLMRLLGTAAEAFAKVEERAGALIEEADPRSTQEMLGDWEALSGLPDDCSTLAGTASERRRAVAMKIIGIGGQSREYFTALARALGYDIVITEYRPFIAGLSRCSRDYLSGGHIVRHIWRVTVRGPRLTWFRAGASRCGERLLSVESAADLECVFRRLKPAHTHLVFAYEGDIGPVPVSDSGQIPVSDWGQVPVSGQA